MRQCSSCGLRSTSGILHADSCAARRQPRRRSAASRRASTTAPCGRLRKAQEHGEEVRGGQGAGARIAPTRSKRRFRWCRRSSSRSSTRPSSWRCASGVDPKHADQMVRGTVVLPHGLGKTKRVLVIAGADKQKEAQEAGADHVGGDDIVEKIQGGWMDFDAVVATPDMMRARRPARQGARPARPDAEPEDRHGHDRHRQGGAARSRPARSSSASTRPASSTRRSARPRSRRDALVANAHALVDSIVKAKPPAAKGKYLKSITVSSTMGPGVRDRHDRTSRRSVTALGTRRRARR